MSTAPSIIYPSSAELTPPEDKFYSFDYFMISTKQNQSSILNKGAVMMRSIIPSTSSRCFSPKKYPSGSSMFNVTPSPVCRTLVVFAVIVVPFMTSSPLLCQYLRLPATNSAKSELKGETIIIIDTVSMGVLTPGGYIPVQAVKLVFSSSYKVQR